LVMVMVSVLLAIVLGLVSIIIGGVNVAESLDHSVKAFHAADTGIERALYNIKNADCDGANASGDFGDSTYSYTVEIAHIGEGTCADANTTITSLGQYLSIKRKIEASY